MLVPNQPELQPNSSTPDEIKFSPLIKRWTVIILAGLLVVFLLHIAEVLPPFIWAVVTAYLFNAPLNFLTSRFGWPRWAGTALIYLIFFVILGIGLLLLIPSLNKEARTLATDAPNIERTVDNYLTENPTITVMGIEINSENVRTSVNNLIKRIPEIAQELGPKLLGSTFRFLIDLLLYLIATFYLMLIGGRTVWRFVNGLPLQYRPEIRDLILRINRVLGAYVKGQFILIAFMSVASFIILTILGVRYALTLSIAVGVLELIPFVGPYLAITTCALVAFFQPHGPKISFGLDGLMLAIIVVVALFVLRQFEDYVVIPAVIGRIVELPPLLVIFSIISGAALLGPMGLLLSVPIVAMLKIIVGYLYYKLVDADRQKVVIAENSSFEQIYQSLQAYPPRSRLLLVLDQHAEYFKELANLKQLKALSQEKLLDLAFYCGEDEKTGHQLQSMGFPVVSMPQEHFLVNNPA